MSAKRHPATHSDECRACGRFGQGDELVAASLMRPDWRRGWVCRAHVEHETPSGPQGVLPGFVDTVTAPL